MIDKVRSWVSENTTLLIFLVGQALAIATAGVAFTAYMVRLETRVEALEVRGSPHLAAINNRLTVTEKETEANKARIERIVDTMTKELHISPSRDRDR